MVGWQRHLQSFVRQTSKIYLYSHNASFSIFYQSKASLVPAEVPYLSSRQDSYCPAISRPLHHYLQKLELTYRRIGYNPHIFPLIPALPSSTGNTETQKAICKTSRVQAVLKGIKQVIHSARVNATHNHGLDADHLLVGFYKKRISYHSKGRCGIKVRPECRLTAVLREMTPEEEAKIAKLKVHNFRKLSKREKNLCPINLLRPLQYGIAKAKQVASNLVRWLSKREKRLVQENGLLCSDFRLHAPLLHARACLLEMPQAAVHAVLSFPCKDRLMFSSSLDIHHEEMIFGIISASSCISETKSNIILMLKYLYFNVNFVNIVDAIQTYPCTFRLRHKQ